MIQSSYCIFKTPLGWCGIAWRPSQDPGNPYAVTSFQLPEATAEMTKLRIAKCIGAPEPNRPPIQIMKTISKVCLHLQGEVQDFRDVLIELEGAEPFVQTVCDAVRKIPAGKTVTYGDIAKAIGKPAKTRAVGWALGRNPIPLIIPCHRVVAASGKPGGFSAFGGRATKAKLLAIEGATVNLCLDLATNA
jgi:O-6-methylguanine DNA methyltransferase